MTFDLNNLPLSVTSKLKSFVGSEVKGAEAIGNEVKRGISAVGKFINPPLKPGFYGYKNVQPSVAGYNSGTYPTIAPELQENPFVVKSPQAEPKSVKDFVHNYGKDPRIKVIDGSKFNAQSRASNFNSLTKKK